MKKYQITKKCKICCKEFLTNKYRPNIFCSKHCRVIDCSGEKNHFYGKKHKKETIEEMSKSHVGKKLSEETKKKLSIISKNNKCGGRQFYKSWIDKYGIEKANQLDKQRLNKLSISMSGFKNPMYNKPSPQGSGNGWSGWYKDYFFRSLRELSYIINILEKDKKEWKSAETKELTIKYIDPIGKNRTYRADFLVDNKYLVEIKPKKIHNTPLIICKKNAAEKFCKENGLIFLLLDCEILSSNEVKYLINNNIIKLTDKYMKLYIEKYGG